MALLRAFTATVVVIAISVGASTQAGALTAAVNRQRFCVPAAVIIDDVQKPVLEIPADRASVLALTLKRTAKAAPRSVGRSMRTMAAMYSATSHATTDGDRAKVVYARAAKFAPAQKVVVEYYSTHCVAPPVSSPSFPVVNGAYQEACLADLATIRMAEMEYSTLNGGFGTMEQLVGAGFLRSASVLHPGITVGTPPGGYTVVGNQTCNNVPVAG